MRRARSVVVVIWDGWRMVVVVCVLVMVFVKLVGVIMVVIVEGVTEDWCGVLRRVDVLWICFFGFF